MIPSAKMSLAPSPKPQSPLTLFVVFNAIALQGFGGVLPVIQREMVEKRAWFSQDAFLHDWALAQILPGPNVVNFALMMGDKHFGWRGACAALAGILLAPLCILTLILLLYQSLATQPHMASALRGLAIASAGLIAASALKMIAGLRGNSLGLRWALAFIGVAFVLVALLRLPMVAVVLGLAPLACALAYFRRTRAEQC